MNPANSLSTMPATEESVLLDPIAEVESGQPSTPKPLNVVNRNFGKNVAWTIIARIVNMARGVCIVPFLLRHLELEVYGIWTTIFLLVMYVGVTTLGISNVYIKYRRVSRQKGIR